MTIERAYCMSAWLYSIAEVSTSYGIALWRMHSRSSFSSRWQSRLVTVIPLPVSYRGVIQDYWRG